MQVTNITELPSGRGMIAKCMGKTFLNVQLPYGTVEQAKRNSFFNFELVYLLRSALATCPLVETLIAFWRHSTPPANARIAEL